MQWEPKKRDCLAGWSVVLVLVIIPTVRTSSNLSLLSGTLRTFQVYACDDEELSIKCSPNTVINIYFAHYGRQTAHHHLCPSSSSITPPSNTSSFTCTSKEALQYSLLQTVEAACREQNQCSFRTGPAAFRADPCPGHRKYAEVAYKCRPNAFLNRVVCEGDRLRLKCQNSLRLVIFSALFGSTHYGVAECPRTDSRHGDECQVSYATETVMSTCHGRRKCVVAADVGTFGNPGCPKGNKLFLKVVYTCVPKEILKDLDLGGAEDDEEDYTGFIEEPRYVPEEVVTSASSRKVEEDIKRVPAKLAPVKPAATVPPTQDQEKKGEAANVFTEWMSAYNYLSAHKEKVILFACVGAALSIFLFGGSYVLHRAVKKRRRRKVQSKKDAETGRSKISLSEALPSEEDCCEMTHLDGIRFSRSSLRQPDYPRTPISPEVANIYYS